MEKKIGTLGWMALALLVVFLGVTSVYAQGPGFGPGAGPRWGERHRWGASESDRGLSLTPEQKANFREMRKKFIGENAQLIGAMVGKRLEVRSLWADPKADPQTILAKEKEWRDLQNQMRDKVIQAKLEVRKILTPEQIANWKPWGMRHRGMMGRGARKGCGFGGDKVHHGFGLGRAQESFLPHPGGTQSGVREGVREDEMAQGDFDLASARGMDPEMGLGWLIDD